MPVPGATATSLRKSYDVVIAGAGVQGLALAYELAKRGVTNVAVLDQRYPGAGASGRNGELIRSAFGSLEWCGLFNESLRRWEGLSEELDFNVLFSRSGYLVVATTQEQSDQCQRDVVKQASYGVQSRYVNADEALEIAPGLNRELVRGGVYQSSAGFAHHDAVVWAYARAAARLGVEIHAATTITGIDVASGGVTGVQTSRGHVATHVVVNAAGAQAGALAAMAEVHLPTEQCRLEIIVTESVAPFLRPALALQELFGYCHQTARGEFVGGTENYAPDNTVSLNGTYEQLLDICAKFVRMIPSLAGVRLLRHWAGVVDQAADMSPVLGPVPELTGFFLDCGWVYGFMGAPAAGALLAEAIIDGVLPPLVAPFTIDRLRGGRLIQESSLVTPPSRGTEG